MDTRRTTETSVVLRHVDVSRSVPLASCSRCSLCCTRLVCFVLLFYLRISSGTVETGDEASFFLCWVRFQTSVPFPILIYCSVDHKRDWPPRKTGFGVGNK